jgi:hypothetical protein
MKQLVQPGDLNDVVSDDAVLSLCTEPGDDRMSIGPVQNCGRQHQGEEYVSHDYQGTGSGSKL